MGIAWESNGRTKLHRGLHMREFKLSEIVAICGLWRGRDVEIPTGKPAMFFDCFGFLPSCFPSFGMPCVLTVGASERTCYR